MSSITIESCGALADGQTVNTQAIQQAIDTQSQSGGGEVRIPPGTWVTGTLFLRSNITLNLEAGAVLKGSPDIADYPRMPWPTNTAVAKDYHWHHLIIAEGVTDVHICGEGVIDGNGPAFWRKPSKPRKWIGYDIPRVEKMVHFRGCKRARIEGVRLENSPAWNLHLFECDSVQVRGVSIQGALFGPNIDGIDIEGCRDVTLSDCHIECGDDAIVAFPSADRDCERVVASNCLIRTNCVGFKAYNRRVGRKVSDLIFTDSIVHHSTRAVGVYNYAPGIIERISVNNIICDSDSGMVLNRPLQIDCKCHPKVPYSPEQMKGCVVRDVSFRNIQVRTDGRLLFTAADGSRIENLSLSDIRFRIPLLDDPRASVAGVRSDQFPTNSPDAAAACALVVADGVRNLSLRDFQVVWPESGSDDDWTGLLDADARSLPYPVFSGEATGFALLWGRRISGGHLDNPMVAPQLADGAKYDLSPEDAIHVRA